MIVKGIQIFGIIVINLFAFLTLGHILDTLFGEQATYKVIALILSICPLVLFMILFIKHSQKQLQNNNHKLSTDGGERNDSYRSEK